MDDVRALVLRATAAEAEPAERLAAFGELVERFQDLCFGYAYAELGDFLLAQDAAQEAFLVAFSQLHRLREPEAFPAWLRRLVLLPPARREPQGLVEAGGGPYDQVYQHTSLGARPAVSRAQPREFVGGAVQERVL